PTGRACQSRMNMNRSLGTREGQAGATPINGGRRRDVLGVVTISGSTPMNLRGKRGNPEGKRQNRETRDTIHVRGAVHNASDSAPTAEEVGESTNHAHP